MGNSLWQRSYDTIFAVNQLIEIAGKRHDRQLAAQAGVFGAKARFYDAKRTLDQGVTKAYIAALLAEENVRILNESSRLLRHEADIAEARFKAGDISDSDKKQIEINAEQYALQAKSAEATAVQARIAVEVLMGVSLPKGNWEPSGALDQLVQAPVPTNQATARSRHGRMSWQPKPTSKAPRPIFNCKRRFGFQTRPCWFNMSISLPAAARPQTRSASAFPSRCPLWNLNGGNIRAAQASVDQYALAFGKVRTQMAADIANAESEYAEAHARWLSYRDQTAPKSAKVRESVAFAYEKGGASLVDLLDAERTDNDVRLADGPGDVRHRQRDVRLDRGAHDPVPNRIRGT